jgi:hypothetical protein
MEDVLIKGRQKPHKMLKEGFLFTEEHLDTGVRQVIRRLVEDLLGLLLAEE